MLMTSNSFKTIEMFITTAFFQTSVTQDQVSVGVVSLQVLSFIMTICLFFRPVLPRIKYQLE